MTGDPAEVPRSPSMRLDGRRALVIGGGRGIGAAAAAALAQAGCEVVIASRTEDEVRAVATALSEQGTPAEWARLDIRNSEAVEAVFAEDGPFDIVVNSAGMNRPKLLTETDDEDIDQILNLNLKAAIYVARAASRHMIRLNRPGSIINISSQMGLVGSPRRTLYAASKHALEGLTKSLAWEVGSFGIRVNTICPTFIRTRFTEQMFEEPGFREWVVEHTALRRVGEVEDIMGAVVFLAGDAASLITGSSLVVDAGWTSA